MYKRILFPTDASDVAAKAMRRALELAKLCGAELHTISAKELFPYGAVSEMQPMLSQEFLKAQERTASQRVKAVMDATQEAGIPCHGSTVEEEHP